MNIGQRHLSCWEVLKIAQGVSRGNAAWSGLLPAGHRAAGMGAGWGEAPSQPRLCLTHGGQRAPIHMVMPRNSRSGLKVFIILMALCSFPFWAKQRIMAFGELIKSNMLQLGEAAG